MSNDKSQYNGQSGNGYQPLPCAPTPPPGPEVGTPTLADVQPGGMVRLGDQAHVTISDNLLSSMAYAIPGAVETTDKAKAVAARVVEVYLSAQPSPGGQGARAQFEEYRGGDCERDAQGYYVNARTAQDWALWQAAISARQAVGEPAAWMDPDGSRVLTAKAKANASGAYKSATSGYTVPLYQPAQAVDLERFRGTVKSQYSMTEWMHRCGFVSAKKLEESKKNHDHLMALIDSQAVGNG